MIPTSNQDFQSLSDAKEYLKLIELCEHEITNSDGERRDVAIYWLFHSYFVKNQYDKALGRVDEIVPLIDSALWKGKILNRIGSIHWLKGELKVAQTYYQQALGLLENHGSSLDQAQVWNNIGIIKDQTGEINQALEFYQKSVELKLKSEEPDKVASTLINIATILIQLKKFEEARSILNEAEKKFSTADNNAGNAMVYNLRFKISIEQDNLEQAEEYLEKYKEIMERYAQIQAFGTTYKMMKAQLLKNTQSLETKGNAIRIFRGIIEQENVGFENKFEAIKQLIELKFEELKIFQSDVTLIEIENLIESIDEIAHQNNMYPLIIDLHILKARFKRGQARFMEAETVLREAEMIVNNKDLNHYREKLEDEFEELNKDLVQMRDLVESNSELVKRMEENYIQEYLKSIKW